MKIDDAVASAAFNPIISAEFEERYNRRQQKVTEEGALKKVEEAQSSNTKATFIMMDRHNEIVKESQEQNKERAEKRALERLAQKRAEERDRMAAEAALSRVVG